MEDQVLKNLIELYKNRGISLENLLVNPLFSNLPTHAKIMLVKKYANELHSGISFDKSDVVNLLKVLGIGATVYGAAKVGTGIMKKLINLPTDASPEDISHAARSAVMTVAPLGMALVPTTGLFVNAIGDSVKNFARKRASKEFLQAIQQNRAPNDNAIRLLGYAHDTIKG